MDDIDDAAEAIMGFLLGNARRALITCVAVVVLAVVGGVLYLSWDRDVTAHVTGKENVCHTRSSCHYLIYTDHGTYQDTDAVTAWKWNSSDVYGAIQTGHDYRFHLRGFRIHITSEYPNILSATEVKGTTP